ncbi:Cloroperoxidase [Schizophyllum commune H4-8]|uniref:Heme haloperoxidase family profile domain-containing protein n=1 Tax=Schizophyllum commune (strain H4-8 / FGSC 9210) TaxID=578458 RepID=D8PX36_SCHCM|nr:Cloroperoxidase [Schizophyllum commune H4-8]KAI5899704.1 Cloroperoxidase [Schizophyllum commune H4-8]
MPSFEFLLACVKTILWDIYLTIANKLTPDAQPGRLIPAGRPGAGGKWPKFVPPSPGDSRCSCPALNAMANHGILPHDGKNITFTEMGEKIHSTYNFAPSFCYFVPNFAANMLGRSYARHTFDLADLDLHNGIEHDASLTRLDSALAPDQGTPHEPFVRELLDSATGRDARTGEPRFTVADLSKISARRRVQARATNGAYSLEKVHQKFSAANTSTMLRIFGGKLDDIETMLIEERIPDGWESSTKARHGLTILSFQDTVKAVAAGIDEGAAAREMEAEKAREMEAETAEKRGEKGKGREGVIDGQAPLLRSRKGMGIGQA